ncbi:hypothetical protein EYF80_051931 [Liparis tanakae]|uniref:Uncharacterized protein n=1 Tax=Liparis tanakae TaxID=230148 RepID=A0A4Z2FAS7_9TELE|nr:hypothetical protein EYF80_051931 [Liparis tanakae]
MEVTRRDVGETPAPLLSLQSEGGGKNNNATTPVTPVRHSAPNPTVTQVSRYPKKNLHRLCDKWLGSRRRRRGLLPAFEDKLWTAPAHQYHTVPASSPNSII